MFTHRDERGLTLIEIILSLAIAGVLAATVLTGRDQLRGRVQFSQAIDQAVQVLVTARGEATATVGSSNFTNGGTQPNEYTFGKLVKFKKDVSVVQVSTVIIDGDGIIQHVDHNPYDVTIPWGVAPSSSKTLFVFGLDGSGRLHSYNPATLAFGNSISTLVPIDGATPATIDFKNGGSQTATVYVDSIGNVTRVIH